MQDMNAESSAFFVTLPGRGLVHLEGGERHGFLQGLISHDIEFLTSGARAALYACLLTAQGKFLHDFFVSEGDGFTLLECEGGARAADLHRRLGFYRLRAQVTLSVEENVPVYAVFGGAPRPGYPDPRHEALGWRSLTRPEGLPEKPFAEWDRRRIALAVPDGSRDMVPEQSTLLECGIDGLNGVSFEKGCYVGQELTARMKHRGLAKKHLYPVRATGPMPLPAAGTDIHVDGRLIGEMRSSCGDLGLALLKDEAADALRGGPLEILRQ